MLESKMLERLESKMLESKIERIASALTKEILASRIVASDDMFVIIDEDGAQEVSENTFHKIIKGSFVRTAGEQEDLDNDQKYYSIGEKWTIYVSPDVQALNPPKDGLKGFPQRVKNFLDSVMNRIYAERKIDKVITDNDVFGYTIQKGKGRYPYINKETGKREVSQENSYIITIYCDKARSVAFKVAEELREAFKQKGVLVDVGRGGQMVEV